MKGTWAGIEVESRAFAYGRAAPLPPLSACGERVGVRGPLRESERFSQTINSESLERPPHPNLLPARGEKEHAGASRQALPQRLCLNAGLFLILAVTALCAPAAAQPSDWKKDWDQTIAAARQEGQLVISAPSGTTWREQLMTFQQAYPAIKLSITASASRDFWPRVVKEREAKLSLWDFRVGGPDNLSYSVKAMGAIAPARDMLILPEVVDNDIWYGGLDGIFLDKDKRYFLGFALYEENTAYYNSRLIGGPDVAEVKSLTDPKWAGKISMADPRAGSPLVASGAMLRSYGEDFLRTLLLRQKPVIVKDPRQQIDWLASGRYPITIGMPSIAFVEYSQRGGNIDGIKKMIGPRTWTQGVGGVQALADPPHPNATKLFVNWLLTRQVQAHIMQAVKVNSRRKDVPIEDPNDAVDYARLDEYVGGQTEAMQPFQRRAAEILREVMQ
jgi:ABC-type Fe3+ transport system substrate-binding protein